MRGDGEGRMHFHQQINQNELSKFKEPVLAAHKKKVNGELLVEKNENKK